MFILSRFELFIDRDVSEQKEHIIDKEQSDQEDLSFQFAFEQVKVRNEKPEPEEATLDGSSWRRLVCKYTFSCSMCGVRWQGTSQFILGRKSCMYVECGKSLRKCGHLRYHKKSHHPEVHALSKSNSSIIFSSLKKPSKSGLNVFFIHSVSSDEMHPACWHISLRCSTTQTSRLILLCILIWL